MKLQFSAELYKKDTRQLPQWASDLDGALVDFNHDGDVTIAFIGTQRYPISKRWCK